VTNRYYLVTSNALLNRFRNHHTDTSNLPDEILHWRQSLDGTQYIVEAEVTDAEDTWARSQNGITYLGNYDPIAMLADQSVFDYLKANAAQWEKDTP
jgi:hypothetical protein